MLEAARTLGIDISAFCYHPGLPVVGAVPAVPGRRSRRTRSCSRAASRSSATAWSSTPPTPQSTLARKQSSSSRWSTTRSTARSATRPASARCRSCTSSTTTRDSRVDTPKVHKAKVVDLGPHDRPRPGALHPVLALHPHLRRGRRSAPARVRQPRRPRDPDHRARRAARQPVLAQHRRRLPGRRADLEGLPVHDARLGARGDAAACATAARPAATSRSTTRTAARGGWSRATTRDVNEYWMCDEGRLHVPRPPRAAARRRRRSTACPPAGTARSRRRRSGSRVGRAAGAVRGRAVGAALQRGQLRAREARAGVGRRRTSTSPRKPPVPARADGRLRVADINPNTRGRQGDRRGARPGALEAGSYELDASTCAASSCSATCCPASTPASSRSSRSSRSPRTSAARSRTRKVALPAAAWAEAAGTDHQRQGPRAAHARGLPAAGPGDPRAGRSSCGSRRRPASASSTWTHAREVFKDMTARSPPWSTLTWAREVAPARAALCREPRLSHEHSVRDPRLARHSSGCSSSSCW